MKKEIYEKRWEDTLIRIEFTCDKCGTHEENNIDDDYGGYDAFAFNFEIQTGCSYPEPEGGYGERYNLNLCKKCSLEFVKFLKENGYNVYTEEWSY